MLSPTQLAAFEALTGRTPTSAEIEHFGAIISRAPKPTDEQMAQLRALLPLADSAGGGAHAA